MQKHLRKTMNQTLDFKLLLNISLIKTHWKSVAEFHISRNKLAEHELQLFTVFLSHQFQRLDNAPIIFPKHVISLNMLI